MRMKIFILEDDARRRDAMRKALADRFFQYPAVFCETASELIAQLREGLPQAFLISLDHDLDPAQDEDGRLAADWLASQPPVCPVVVHSSNGDAAVGMQQALNEAGWLTFRSYPGGDLDWIAEDWLPTVRTAIRKWMDLAIEQQKAAPRVSR